MTNPTLDHETEGALRSALARAARPHGASPALHRRLAAQRYSTGSSRPMVAAGLASAAALSGVAVLAAGGRAGEGPVAPSHLHGAQLTAEITSALDGASGDIFEVHTAGGGTSGSATHWLSADGDTLRVAVYAADGSLAEDESFVTQGDQQVITDVNETAKTWWTITVPTSSTSPQPAPSAQDCSGLACASTGQDGVPPGGLLGGSPTSAAGVAWLLNQGGFVKTGQTEMVDGIPNAFEIKSGAASATNGFTFSNMEMWIDPATNLPVQVSLGELTGPYAFAINAVPNQPETVARPATPIISDVTWLSPTAANEAQLQATVPAGFTQVPPPSQAFAATTPSS